MYFMWWRISIWRQFLRFWFRKILLYFVYIHLLLCLNRYNKLNSKVIMAYFNNYVFIWLVLSSSMFNEKAYPNLLNSIRYVGHFKLWAVVSKINGSAPTNSLLQGANLQKRKELKNKSLSRQVYFSVWTVILTFLPSSGPTLS